MNMQSSSGKVATNVEMQQFPSNYLEEEGSTSNAVRFTRVKHPSTSSVEVKQTRPSVGQTDVSEINVNTLSPRKSSPIQASTSNVDRVSSQHPETETYLKIRMNPSAHRSTANISSSSVSYINPTTDPVIRIFILGNIF